MSAESSVSDPGWLPSVLNAGAIGSGWVLQAAERWAAVLRNVLAHFGRAKGQV